MNYIKNQEKHPRVRTFEEEYDLYLRNTNLNYWAKARYLVELAYPEMNLGAIQKKAIELTNRELLPASRRVGEVVDKINTLSSFLAFLIS